MVDAGRLYQYSARQIIKSRMKQRNKAYNLSEMEVTDRFYFVGDRKRTVYQLTEYKPFETIKQKSFWIRYANCIPSYKATIQQVKYPERHRADRKVIFLRNILTP